MLNPINTFKSSPTHSTGPKPSQLVPKINKCALESQNHQIGPNKPIIISKLENNNFVLLKKNNITVVNPLLFSPL